MEKRKFATAILKLGIPLFIGGSLLYRPVVLDLALSNSNHPYWNRVLHEIPLETGALEKKVEFEGTFEEKALSYLKMAHAMATKSLDFRLSPDRGTALSRPSSRGEGNCFDYSSTTYSNYLQLISNSGNGKLRNYVRIAFGDSWKADGTEEYHAWLEIKRDGEWKHYEALERDLEQDVQIDPSSIHSLIRDSEVIEPSSRTVSRLNSFRLEEDGSVHGEVYFLSSLPSRLR